jgi:Zn-dependent peptidase ImmA (M78 family)/transcriptional regulator with XRE-family HTH domain
MSSGKRIRQARELRLLTQRELATRVGRTQGAIAHVEAGYKEASPELVSRIAQETGFPLPFFAAEPPVEFPVNSVMFRARAATTRRQAVAACRYAEILYEMAQILAEHVTTITLNLQTRIEPPALAAQNTRRSLRMPPDTPIPHLIDLVERAGVTVLPVPIDLKGVDAFSAWIRAESTKPVLAICNRLHGDRLRFSVAHELGHLIMHSDRKLRSDEHARADQFAAEFLMPEPAMRREINSPVTLSGIAPLKPRWGVSIQALVRRAYDLQIIGERQYRYLFEQLSIKGWKAKEPSNLDVPSERPRAMKKMAELIYGMPIDYARLASDVRLSLQTVREIIESCDDRPSSGKREDQQLSFSWPMKPTSSLAK